MVGHVRTGYHLANRYSAMIHGGSNTATRRSVCSYTRHPRCDTMLDKTSRCHSNLPSHLGLTYSSDIGYTVVHHGGWRLIEGIAQILHEETHVHVIAYTLPILITVCYSHR